MFVDTWAWVAWAATDDVGLAHALVLIEVVEALADVGAVEVVGVDEALWTAAAGFTRLGA